MLDNRRSKISFKYNFNEEEEPIKNDFIYLSLYFVHRERHRSL